MILEEGIENVFKRHQRISTAIIVAIENIGLELYPINKKSVSPTVTAIKVPEGINSDELIKHLWSKYGVLIAGAWGSILGGKVIRLGNMGYGANPHFAIIALVALERALMDFGFNIKSNKLIEVFMNNY